MLRGKRPEECDYCWNVEDNSKRFSDRVFKSAESWSWPYKEEIFNSRWNDDYNPKYVEVAFSNACNFKCAYCGPAYSSTWAQEIERYGGYPTLDKFNDSNWLKSEDKVPLLQSEYNPYVEAFWKWWPNLYRDLHTFRITGGEPLLSKDTWGVLDYIIENSEPNRDLHLAINSNLGVPDSLIDKLIEKIKIIEEKELVKELVIFTSCDTWGEHAEYIRTGLEFNRFWDNINKILSSCKKVVVTFMVTYNALSVFHYDKLIKEIYELKKEYGSDQRYWNSATFLDTSYLRHPQHLTIKILPFQFSENILNQSKLVTFYNTPSFDTRLIGYSDVETQKIKRLYDWMITPQDEIEQMRHRYSFGKYIEEHDKRRGTNFTKTFPEMEEFYNFCKNIQL